MRVVLSALLLSGALWLAPAPAPALALSCSSIKVTVKSNGYAFSRTVNQDKLVEELTEAIERFGDNGQLEYDVADKHVIVECVR